MGKRSIDTFDTPGATDRTGTPAARAKGRLRLRSGRPAREGEAPPGFREVDRAHVLLRRATATMERVCAREGWPVPSSPVRFLVLGHLHRASAFGLSPARIARKLRMKRSSLAHHLDVLEEAELIERDPAKLTDGRKVAARLTERGLYALWAMGAAVERGPLQRASTPR